MVGLCTGGYVRYLPRRNVITSSNTARLPDVLVVDDDTAVAAVVARYLEHAGMRVQVAASGADALRVMENGAAGVRVVLTDLRMRGMSGLGLAGELAVRHPGTKVLFMSGCPDNDALPGPFIPKPFKEHQLLTAVQRLRNEPAA